MHRPPPPHAAVLAAMLLHGLPTPSTTAVMPETLTEARALLNRGEAVAAVAFLEEALAATPSHRDSALLDLLRQAYTDASKEAEARGRTSDSELFRDNLEILNRKHPAPAQSVANRTIAQVPDPSSSPAASRVTDVTVPLSPARTEPAVDPDIPPKPQPPRSAPPPLPSPSQAPAPAPVPAASAEAPASMVAPPPAPAPSEIKAADAAFRAQRYDEAGRLYADLDREKQLPANRRDHWAYCRCAEVVRRINAKPRTPREWAEIDAEIGRIRALSPNNWYGEYLRNRAAERSPGDQSGKSNRLLVRGSAPEEPAPNVAPAPVPPARALARAHAPATKPATALAPLPKPVGEARPPAAGPSPGPEAARATRPAPAGAVAWQTRETPNFRILHVDPELAEKAAEVAEAARESQIRRWIGSAPKGPWSPRCDVYLYPTPAIFSQMTGQPEESPGFSTMGMNGGRIIARRINLRVDHPNLLKAILPHEITHVVLADLFPNQQIPRWADEGMAVLSEPPSEQHLRASDLDEPLVSGQLFKLEQLMAMDYPDGKFWGLYYAQSVSLTRFLVEQGSPAQFIKFVQQSQLNGVEAELRRIYKFDGFRDLQERWMTYARSKSAEITASSTDSEKPSPSALR